MSGGKDIYRFIMSKNKAVSKRVREKVKRYSLMDTCFFENSDTRAVFFTANDLYDGLDKKQVVYN